MMGFSGLEVILPSSIQCCSLSTFTGAQSLRSLLYNSAVQQQEQASPAEMSCDARVHETSLGEQLGDWCLTTLEGWPRSRTRPGVLTVHTAPSSSTIT